MHSVTVLLGLTCLSIASPPMGYLNSMILSKRQSCSTPDGSGSCESTSSCGGFSVAGYCPGSSDIQCCVTSSCSNSDGSGTCMSTSSSCSGSFVSGLCPGDSSIECCMTSSGGGSSSGSGSGIVDAAQAEIGVPYVYGGGGCEGESDGGFDCSGLTQYAVCQAGGPEIPRTAQTQYDSSLGTAIPVSEAQPGDLVFWGENGDCTSSVDHCAVFNGSNEIIAAPETGEDVQEQTLWTSSGGLELCPNAMRFWS